MLYHVSISTAHSIAKDIFGSQNIVTKTFSMFFGASVSKLVLPAQNLTSDPDYVQYTKELEKLFQSKILKNSQLSFELHQIESFDGALIETMELCHQEQLTKPKKEQRYVLYLCGNGMCMQELYNEIYLQCTQTKHNFVAFNYRNVIKSQGSINQELDLINDVISQVERLRDEGVPLKNICLVGHSLGAAFATLTSYVYLKEGEPLKIFNGRSFSNFASMTFWQAKHNGASNLEAMFKKMLLSLSNFEIEVAQYYNLLPDEDKDYITVEQKDSGDGSTIGVPDGVIPPEASLGNCVQDKSSRHKVISTNRLFGFGHNDPLSTLMSHDNNKTADKLCREFILK